MEHTNSGGLAQIASRPQTTSLQMSVTAAGEATYLATEPGTYLMKISGSIVDESLLKNFSIPADARRVTVNCKFVDRVNSCGTRAWLRFFGALTARGIELSFAECSLSIVDRFNLLPSFSCGGTIVSIYVPYWCQSCQTELVGLLTANALREAGGKAPTQCCRKCGGSLELDDRAENYFAFLFSSAVATAKPLI